MDTYIYIHLMPTANVRLRSQGKGCKRKGELLVRYMGASLAWLTIRRLGLIVSASASGELRFLLLLREPSTGESSVAFFTRCISLVTAGP